MQYVIDTLYNVEVTSVLDEHICHFYVLDLAKLTIFL